MIDEKVLVVVVFALLCEETGEFLDSKSTYPPPPPMCTYAVATELTLNSIFTFLLRVVGSGGEKQN